MSSQTESQSLVLQRKIIGVLVRAAREKAHRSTAEAAQRLGVTPVRLRQYESGARDISLPELEILALYFQIPLSFFLNGTSEIEEPVPAPPTEAEMRTRRSLIAAKLKQARLAAGKTKQECAQVIKRTAAMFNRYEKGAVDIPITELETLAQFLSVNLYYFVEKGVESGGGDVLDLDRLARLPKEVRVFILDPGNLPYLRMAMKLHALPADELKELGEILLVVR